MLIETLVGAMKADEQPSEEQHVQDLQVALQKLPRIHLIVLDTLIKHLRECVFTVITNYGLVLMVFLALLTAPTKERSRTTCTSASLLLAWEEVRTCLIVDHVLYADT